MDFERVKHLEQEVERLTRERDDVRETYDRVTPHLSHEYQRMRRLEAAEARILELEADLEIERDKGER